MSQDAERSDPSVSLDAALSKYHVTKETLHTLPPDTLNSVYTELLQSTQPIWAWGRPHDLDVGRELLADPRLNCIHKSAFTFFFSHNVFKIEVPELHGWLEKMSKLAPIRECLRYLMVRVETRNDSINYENAAMQTQNGSMDIDSAAIQWNESQTERLSALFQLPNLELVHITLRKDVQYLDTYANLRSLAPLILHLRQTKQSTEFIVLMNEFNQGGRQVLPPFDMYDISDYFNPITEEDKTAVKTEMFTKSQWYRVQIQQWAEMDREKLSNLVVKNITC